MTVTIYHNPDCGTSSNTLAMIRQSGEVPELIEYLKTLPTRDRLTELIAKMGISVRALLREKGTPYADLGLAEPGWTDAELIDAMLANPILINRPIVTTSIGWPPWRHEWPADGRCGAHDTARPKGVVYNRICKKCDIEQRSSCTWYGYAN